MTPPLNPAKDHLLLELIQDSSDFEMELFSDGPDSDLDLQRKIDKILAGEDPDFIDEGLDIRDLYPPLGSTLATSSPTVPPNNFGPLRVEQPLSPPAPTRVGNRFQFDDINEDVNYESLQTSAWIKESDQSTSDTLANLDDFLGPIVEKVNIAAENEHLTVADSTMRAEVPSLQPPVFNAPWNVTDGLLQTMKDEVTEILEPMEMGIHLDRHLQWRPFPNNLSEVALAEKIDNLEYLNGIIEYKKQENLMNTDLLIWKMEGLRVLDDHDSDDEELAAGDFKEEDKGIDFLIRKRKAEQILEVERKRVLTNMPEKSEIQVRAAGQQTLALNQKTTTSASKFPRNSAQSSISAVPKNMSASDSIGLFFGLQGIAPSISKINHRPYLSPNLVQEESTMVKEVGINSLHSESRTTITTPSLPSSLPTCYVIVSSQLLQHRRSLVRKLTASYPTCNLIERDFSVLSLQTNTAQFKSKVDYFDPGMEADLVLSPKTGMLITTIQKIQQRSLPGQGPNESIFHRRLRHVSVKYERVIVLVSHGVVENESTTLTTLTHGIWKDESVRDLSQSATTAVTDRDTHAMMALHSIASKLSADIHIQFVLGGENNLASWMVLHISQACTKYRLDPEESQWEQLLRRVGLNPFATTIILSVLKFDDASTTSEEMRFSQHGLAAFLGMSAGERVSRFGGLLGQKVMKRVNGCLERGWISESTGFRV